MNRLNEVDVKKIKCGYTPPPPSKLRVCINCKHCHSKYGQRKCVYHGFMVDEEATCFDFERRSS